MKNVEEEGGRWKRGGKEDAYPHNYILTCARRAQTGAYFLHAEEKQRLKGLLGMDVYYDGCILMSSILQR